jgi:hypothetical protein
LASLKLNLVNKPLPDSLPAATRGSRKHVLDWTSSPDFLREFSDLLATPEVDVADARYMPRGYGKPAEARLESFGPVVLPGHPAWSRVADWWLRHSKGANTPNWDIAVTAMIEGRPGLVLVEAKANVPELSRAGKPMSTGASKRSQQNHEQIGHAIEQANTGWRSVAPEARLTRDSHYQLANRLAFVWKLASEGVPILLLYLGFTGDDGIADAGEPLRDDSHWRQLFREHLQELCVDGCLDRRVLFGDVPVRVISRSRPVLSVSPPRHFRRP